MELKIIRRNIATLSNESLKSTRNSPVIFSRLGVRPGRQHSGSHRPTIEEGMTQPATPADGLRPRLTGTSYAIAMMKE
jgi:hypothetical protein